MAPAIRALGVQIARILGAWLMIACFAYLALSFSGFLFPAYEDKVINDTEPVLLAEVAIMGAKEQRLTAAS